MPTTADGREYDKFLYFGFMRMGKGDCTVIRTPTGEIFIIDIGSNGLDSENGIVQTPEVNLGLNGILGVDKNIEALILTHSDKDHYNKIGYLYNLGANIKKVYHSNDFNKYNIGSTFNSKANNPPDNWIKKDVKQWERTSAGLIQLMMLDEDGYIDHENIRRVTFTGAQKYFTSFDPEQDEYVSTNIVQGNGINQYSNDRGIKIFEKSGCKISLLCGDIYSQEFYNKVMTREKKRKLNDGSNKWDVNYDDSKSVNMASIITLIEYKRNKIIVSGDAVSETEKFVVDTYPGVSSVSTLQASHHGSITNGSNSSAYANRMKPQRLVTSAPKGENGNNHPRCEAINNYINSNNNIKSADKIKYACTVEEEIYVSNNSRKRKLVKKMEYNEKNEKYSIHATGWQVNPWLLFE